MKVHGEEIKSKKEKIRRSRKGEQEEDNKKKQREEEEKKESKKDEREDKIVLNCKETKSPEQIKNKMMHLKE